MEFECPMESVGFFECFAGYVCCVLFYISRNGNRELWFNVKDKKKQKT